MHDSSLSGTWVFEPQSSQMFAPTPMAWVQRIRYENGQLTVHEEITRRSGISYVEVCATTDGGYYTVSGSPIADEIAYWWEDGILRGLGRKDSVDFLRETIHQPDPNSLIRTMLLLIDGKEVPLGTARFRREDA